MLRSTTDLQMTPSGDRFIPSRSNSLKDVAHFNLMSENSFDSMDVESSPAKAYKSQLSQSLFGEEQMESKILAMKNKAPAPRAGYQNQMAVLYSQNLGKVKKAPTSRAIPSTAERVLDAPGLSEDYYLNLLDWGANNMVVVALGASSASFNFPDLLPPPASSQLLTSSLGNSAYLWNASTNEINELVNFADREITSVAFCPHTPDYVSIGTEEGFVQLWDVTRSACLRTMDGHSGRVGALAWNGGVLSSGSFDSTIVNHDVRLASHHVSTFARHEGEICGLKWSADGTTLASGGNDNMLCLWGQEGITPRFVLTEHVAAVKALAWCPFQSNLLASGGGTADRTIKFCTLLSSLFPSTHLSQGTLRLARASTPLTLSHRWLPSSGPSTARSSSPRTVSPRTSSACGSTLPWSRWLSSLATLTVSCTLPSAPTARRSSPPATRPSDSGRPLSRRSSPPPRFLRSRPRLVPRLPTPPTAPSAPP